MRLFLALLRFRRIPVLSWITTENVRRQLSITRHQHGSSHSCKAEPAPQV